MLCLLPLTFTVEQGIIDMGYLKLFIREQIRDLIKPDIEDVAKNLSDQIKRIEEKWITWQKDYQERQNSMNQRLLKNMDDASNYLQSEDQSRQTKALEEIAFKFSEILKRMEDR